MRVLSLLACLACAAPAQRVEVGGVRREYLLHAPAGLDRPAPLLLVFHGGGGRAANMPSFTGFDRIADAEHFIVAYPQGIEGHWNDGRGLSPADDVAFVSALIAEIARSHPIDPARIYATGISNGGFFAQRLACELAGRFAAVASVAATIPEPLAALCRPARAVAVMFIHGTDDPVVLIDGGPVARTHGRSISLDAAVRFWVERDRAAKDPAAEDLPGRDSNGTRVHREIHGGGEGGAEVAVYTIRGGGHTWPGSSQYLPAFLVGKVNHDLDASRAIWDFFARHAR